VLADPTNATRTMIAEFPNTGCIRDAGATSRRKMAAARAALLCSCGPARTGRFGLLTGHGDDHRRRVL